MTSDDAGTHVRSRARRNAIVCGVLYLIFGFGISAALSRVVGLGPSGALPVHIAATVGLAGIVYYIRLRRLTTRLPRSFGGDTRESTRGAMSGGLSGNSQRASNRAVVDWVDQESEPRVEGFSLRVLDLVGREDPVDGTVLGEGEEIVVCLSCRTGYHRDSWRFLVTENGGRCVSCESVGRTQLTVLRVRPQASEAESESVVDCPACAQRNRVPAGRPKALAVCGKCRHRLFPSLRDTSAPPVVGLSDVRRYVGCVVLFEGYAHDSYASRRGTYFVKFEPGHVRNVFKLVIFEQYAPSFQRAGVKIEQYKGQTLRVRGLVQRHPRWGIEMIINSPNVIQIVRHG